MDWMISDSGIALIIIVLALLIPDCLLKLGHCKVSKITNLTMTLTHMMTRNQKQPELE